MKYIKVFENFEHIKKFESVFDDCPKDVYLRRMVDEVMDIFTEMKDKWLIQYNDDVGIEDADQHQFWIEYKKKSIKLIIYKGYCDEDVYNDFDEDVLTFIKRMELDGFICSLQDEDDIDYDNDTFEIRIKEKLKKTIKS